MLTMQRGVLCLVLLLLFGCSDSNNGKRTEQRRATVFDPQLEALERAKGVERQIEEAAAKQRQAIAEQGG